jgi:hypothetical protein
MFYVEQLCKSQIETTCARRLVHFFMFIAGFIQSVVTKISGLLHQFTGLVRSGLNSGRELTSIEARMAGNDGSDSFDDISTG